MLIALCLLAAAQHAASAPANGIQASGHTSNWAVLLSTSRYWFNYRHISDALTFYHICRRSGTAIAGSRNLRHSDAFTCQPCSQLARNGCSQMQAGHPRQQHHPHAAR